MLNWGFPAALWFGIMLLPITVFYFLRIRFRRQPVSSIYLWSKILNKTRGGSKLRRRSILLLVLQLLAALAGIIALTQPFWDSRILNRPGVIFMLDVSASMAATDVSRNQSKAVVKDRLDQAKSLLRKEILKLPPHTDSMIFICSTGIEPLGTPTANHSKLLNLLNRVKVSNAGFDEAEVAAEMQSWLAIHKGIWKACLVTDGGLDLGGRRLTAVFGSALRSIPVGSNGNNIGITGLRFQTKQAEFSVSNGWPVERAIQVSLYKDGMIIASNNLTAPTGVSSQTLQLSQSVQPGVYRIQLDQKPDALASDDRYYLAVNQPRPIRVLLVGQANPFLQAALEHPGIQLVEALSLPRDFNGEGWDLIIADRTSVPSGLRCNLLSFGTMPPDAPFRAGNPVNGYLESYETNQTHLLLRFINLQSIRVNSGESWTDCSDVAVLATVEGHPALVAWEKEGWHKAAASFDLYQSDFGLSSAFPIFMQNLLQWCVPQYNNPLAYTLTVGETVTLAEPPAWQIIDAGSAKTVRKGVYVTIKAAEPGIFAWGRGITRGVLVANIPAGELDLTPQPLHLGKMVQQLSVGNSIQRLPLVKWALILLLICLCIEWILWRGLPGGKGLRDNVVD